MREWLAERLDGLLNPILVKEVQQGFRGRGLLVGAVCALGFCLGAYVYTALSGGDSGDDLFNVLSLSMAAVALVIVPIGTGRLLKHEIEDGTAELIAVTGLSAWTNISGRLQAATLKILLLLALMAPFAVVTVLLGGVGFEEVIVTVAFNLLVAIGFCAIALMVSATTSLCSPVLRVALNVQYLLFPILGFAAATEILPELVRHHDLERIADWLLWLLVIVGVGCPFSVSVAADLLHRNETHSFARSKLLLAGVLLVALVPTIWQLELGTHGSGIPEALWFMAFLSLLIFSMFWSGVERPQPIYGVGWFFSGGFGPTITYLGLGTFVLALLSGAVELDVSTRIMALAGMAYFVLLAGTARLIRRLVDPHLRFTLLYPALFLVLAAAVLFANVIHVDVADRPHHDIEMMLFPVEYFRDNAAFWRSGHLLLLPVFLGLGYGWLGRRRQKAKWQVMVEQTAELGREALAAATLTVESMPAEPTPDEPAEPPRPKPAAQTPPPLPTSHLRALPGKLAS